jgi:hypothetical protein
MGTYTFWVFSNPVEGREREYDEWAEAHVRDVVSVPGFRSAQRFTVHDVGRGELAHRYLAIYEMEASTEPAAAAALAALADAGLSRSDAARDDIEASVFETCSPMVKNPAAGASGDFIFVSTNNPVEGREAEYNAWYDDRHIAEVVGVQGFTTGTRLVRRRDVIGQPTHRYLAVYHMEADSHEAAAVAMQRGADAGLSYSNDIAKGGFSMLLQACSPRVNAPGERALA